MREHLDILNHKNYSRLATVQYQIMQSSKKNAKNLTNS